MFISFSNGKGFALRTAWIAVGYLFRKRPCAMYKDNAVGHVVAETGSDLVFGTTARLSDLSNAVDRRGLTLTWTSARPSAAADSEERQIVRRVYSRESVGLCLCLLPSCVMYKDNAVANVVAEMGWDLVLYDYGTTERSFNCRWKARLDAHQNSLHGSR